MSWWIEMKFTYGIFFLASSAYATPDIREVLLKESLKWPIEREKIEWVYSRKWRSRNTLMPFIKGEKLKRVWVVGLKITGEKISP